LRLTVPMQHLIREPRPLTNASVSEWRVNVLILATALISSQGCTAISDRPGHTVSMKQASPAESKINNPPNDEPLKHTFPQEITPKAEIPSPRQLEPAAAIARIPAPVQPTMMETGLASWYGPKFHGKRTASGEVFNQEKLTAAHPTLPWGSRVKVTNLANGKSVDVRINDRGPFGKGRIIDVSRAAARALDMVERGITTVQLEWLSDSEPSNELVLQDK
jgi:peptidoglycan lytic transglycosylase